MKINFTGHKIDLTEALQNFTREKFDKLVRHFDRIINVHVTFTVEKINHTVEATLHIPGKDIHASSESTVSMYNAIDILIDKLDRLLKKHKDKNDHHRD